MGRLSLAYHGPSGSTLALVNSKERRALGLEWASAYRTPVRGQPHGPVYLKPSQRNRLRAGRGRGGVVSSVTAVGKRAGSDVTVLAYPAGEDAITAVSAAAKRLSKRISGKPAASKAKEGAKPTRGSPPRTNRILREIGSRTGGDRLKLHEIKTKMDRLGDGDKLDALRGIYASMEDRLDMEGLIKAMEDKGIKTKMKSSANLRDYFNHLQAFGQKALDVMDELKSENKEEFARLEKAAKLDNGMWDYQELLKQVGARGGVPDLKGMAANIQTTNDMTRQDLLRRR